MRFEAICARQDTHFCLFLLSKLSGAESLDNILAIRMTDCIYLVKNPLFQPEAYTLHVEVPQPNREGLMDIVKILYIVFT